MSITNDTPILTLPPENTKTRLHLYYLDGLRGLAALSVVLHHFLAWDSIGLPRWAELAVLPFYKIGHTAVGIFIILSGFSLMLPIVREGNLRGGWRGFIMRRARRILPPYYAASALSIAVIIGIRHQPWSTHLPNTPNDLNSADLVSHLLLIHNLSPHWIHAINMAFWSVATEWQIYFLLPLVFIPLWKYAGKMAVVIAGFSIGLLPLVITFFPGALHGADLSGPCFWYAGLFASGAMGAVLFVRGTVPRPSQLMFMSFLALVCYGTTLHILPEQTMSMAGPKYYLIKALHDGLTGFCTLCLILYCASYPCILRRFLETRPLRALGAFSYSLYLTHCIVLEMVDSWGLDHDISAMPMLALKASAIPIAIGFAFLFHVVFERPFMSPWSQKKSLHFMDTPSSKTSRSIVLPSNLSKTPL